MILSGGDLGGQLCTETYAVGDIIIMDGYIYRVISEDVAFFEGVE